MILMWATRGRTWGFRFLRRDPQRDPLTMYEEFFPPTELHAPPVRKVRDKVAVHLPDPQGRRDRSGRIIMHDFVLGGDDAALVSEVDDVERIVWPQVAKEYGEIWDQPDSPPA